MRPWMRYLVPPAVLLIALLLGVRPVYLFAPLMGYAIWRIGMASLASFDRPAAHIPDGEPEPVDVRLEQVTYWCAGCGTELLLLVRGTASPPRHCGERMHERVEVPRDLRS